MQENKFSVSRAYLMGALKSLSAVINPSSVLPILEGFKIEVSETKYMTITVTDLETSVSVSIPIAHTTGNFSFVLTPPVFNSLQNMKNDFVDFTVKQAGESCIALAVQNGRFKAKFLVSPSDEFPIVPEVEAKGTAKLSAIDLQDYLSKALNFVTRDDLRPAMTGICLDNSKAFLDGLVLVATDAHRLYVSPIANTILNTLEGQIIIPAKAASLIKSESLVRGTVTIHTDYNHVVVESNTSRIVTRLIDAKFPQYEAIVGTLKDEWDNNLTFNRKGMIEALRIVQTTSNPNSKQVAFECLENCLHVVLSSQDVDAGFESEISIATVDKKFNDRTTVLQTSFNSQLLIECLSLQNDDLFTLRFKNATNGVNVGENGNIILLMPLIFNGGAASGRPDIATNELPPSTTPEAESTYETDEEEKALISTDEDEADYEELEVRGQVFLLRKVKANDSQIIIAPEALKQILNLNKKADKAIDRKIFAYVPEVQATPEELTELQVFKENNQIITI